MNPPSPRHVAQYATHGLWKRCLALSLSLSCSCFAQSHVIVESEGAVTEAQPQKSPATVPLPKPESETAAQNERQKKLKEMDQGLRAIDERLKKSSPTPTPSPRPKPARSESKAPPADWAGTWTGELTCIDSPEGQQGMAAGFVVRIARDNQSGTLQAGRNPPLPCRISISGNKAVLTALVHGTGGGTMRITTVMSRAGRQLSSVTVRTANDRGITSAVTGEMERQ